MRSPEVKLRDILASLGSNLLGLYDLLAEAKKDEGSNGGQRQWECLLDGLANDHRHHLQPYFISRSDVSKLSGEDSSARDKAFTWEAQAIQGLRNEVQAVGRSQIFGRWTEDNPANFFAIRLPQAMGVISEYAPRLTEILPATSLSVGNAPLEAKGSLVSIGSEHLNSPFEKSHDV